MVAIAVYACVCNEQCQAQLPASKVAADTFDCIDIGGVGIIENQVDGQVKQIGCVEKDILFDCSGVFIQEILHHIIGLILKSRLLA